MTLRPGDRVLLFTDGVVEERLDGGQQFGEQRLREFIEATAAAELARDIPEATPTGNL